MLSVELQMAMRDRRVWRQMVGVSRVVSGNERQRSGNERQMVMRDRRVCRQMVGVSRVVSGNERQRSLETDGCSQ